MVQSGDRWAAIADHFNYPGGTAYVVGIPDPNDKDFWFREGVLVPGKERAKQLARQKYERQQAKASKG